MKTKNRWKTAIVLALIVFSTYSLIALVEVFFPLFKFFALDYSVLVFIGFLAVFSMYDLFLLHFFFLFFKSSPVEQTALRMAVRFVCAGLVISIFIKCFYMFYYLFQWRFLPGLFSDIWLILSDLTTYIPFMIFLYFFHGQLQNIEGSGMKRPCLFSLIGCVVIVFLNGITLLSLLFPGIFSWYFTIEFSIIITLPRALSFFSLLYLFFAFRKFKV
jgi:hypothetical protein